MTGAPPSEMTAIEIAEPGGPEALRPISMATPRPGFGEALIKVAAAGVNRPDVLQRRGGYAPPPGAPATPGLEVAGEIAALGDGVHGLTLGERVCALVAGGGYAEYCAAPAAQILPLPQGVDMVAGGGLPETFFTVWTNLFERVGLRGGETVLIHGGSSGIGVTAIQLASAFGARVFATAGSAEKCAACEALGAERAINYRDEDFVAIVKQATGGRGLDVILDMVGGDYGPRNVASLAVEGRLVQIAFLKGAKFELNLEPVMRKRLTLTGSTLRPRSIEDKGLIADALREHVWPLLETGRVKVIVDSTFPLAEAAAAHARMETSAHIGKIVLTV